MAKNRRLKRRNEHGVRTREEAEFRARAEGTRGVKRVNMGRVQVRPHRRRRGTIEVKECVSGSVHFCCFVPGSVRHIFVCIESGVDPREIARLLMS